MSSSVLMDDRLHHEVLELFTRLNICGSDNVRAEVRHTICRTIFIYIPYI